jgi:hypothetical protein
MQPAIYMLPFNSKSSTVCLSVPSKEVSVPLDSPPPDGPFRRGGGD